MAFSLDRPLNRWTYFCAWILAGLSLGMGSAYAEDKVLVVRTSAMAAGEILEGFQSEMEDELEFVVHELAASDDQTVFEKLLEQYSPRAVVLMDNRVLRLYRLYQGSQPESTAFPPAVVVMAAFAEQASQGVKNISGIAYEVPVVTSVLQVRLALGLGVTHIGVVYRGAFEDFVLAQSEQAAGAGLKIHAAKVKGDSPEEVRFALSALQRRGVDVIWVLNDSELLSPSMISGGWLPGLRRLKLPVIVGVAPILDPRLGFGTLGVLPDHSSLGAQVATMILDLADNEWQLGSEGFEVPASVVNTVNMVSAGRLVELDEERLTKFDKVLD